MLYRVLPLYQLAENLLGKAKDPLKLTGSAMDEDQMLEKFCKKEHQSQIHKVRGARLILLYLLGAYELCEEERVKYELVSQEISTHISKVRANLVLFREEGVENGYARGDH